jgi:hypothetical protein
MQRGEVELQIQTIPILSNFFHEFLLWERPFVVNYLLKCERFLRFRFFIKLHILILLLEPFQVSYENQSYKQREMLLIVE